MPTAKTTTKTGTAKSSTAKGAGKSTTKKPPAKPTTIDEDFYVGDYHVIINGTSDVAKAKVTRNEDVILDKEYTPKQLPKVAGHSKKIDAIYHARLEAIAAYHEAVKPVDGLIDTSVLVEHPYNAVVYGDNEPIDDLIELLEKPEAQVFEITINENGQVLSGNRRLKAAIAVNQKCPPDQPPKFEFLPVKILKFESPEDELKRMILENQSRKKTSQQIAREAKSLIALSDKKAVPVANRLKSEEVVGLLQQLLGSRNRSSTINAKMCLQKIEGYKDRDLAAQIETMAVNVPNKARVLVETVPPNGVDMTVEEYQRLILNRNNLYPNESIANSQIAVNRELAAKKLQEERNANQGNDNGTFTHETSNTETTSTDNNSNTDDGNVDNDTGTEADPVESTEEISNPDDEAEEKEEIPTTPDIVALENSTLEVIQDDRICKALEAELIAGAKPTDSRLTPDDLVYIALDFMRNIDIDAFASLSEQDHIPASKYLTVIDDTFAKDEQGDLVNPLEGNIFANPPFSRASEAIALVDSQICKGNIRKLFLILPVSVQSSKAYHEFLKRHNPIVWQPGDRISFSLGDLAINQLFKENKLSKVNSKEAEIMNFKTISSFERNNREPSVILGWSQDEYDYNVFLESAKAHPFAGWIGRSYAPFNPFIISKVLEEIKWVEEDLGNGKQLISANVFGVKTAITRYCQDTKTTYTVSVNDQDIPETYTSMDSARYIGIMSAIARLVPVSQF